MYDDLLTAKKIFMRYEGSHFYMSCDGEYENYKKFKVKKEQEKEWIKEYQIETIGKLEKNNF